MVVVAVAGGTGGVGRTIIEQLALSPKHVVRVLTRSEIDASIYIPDLLQIPKDTTSEIYVQVNYDDIVATAKSLESLNVHTVISAISIESAATSQAQLNLIRAAEKSNATKRFVPSEYGFIARPEMLELDPSLKYWIDNAEALKRSELQYTRFVNGFFMDYWGMPYIKTNLQPFPWAIDVLNRRAAIPGTGEELLSLTYSADLAKFIVRVLDLDEWPEISVVVGEDTTFNRLLELAEEIRGSKFHVQYDSEDMLKNGQATMFSHPSRDGEELKDLVVLFGRMTVSGIFHMPTENRLNSVFKDVQTMSVKTMLREAWESR